MLQHRQSDSFLLSDLVAASPELEVLAHSVASRKDFVLPLDYHPLLHVPVLSFVVVLAGFEVENPTTSSKLRRLLVLDFVIHRIVHRH